MTDHTSNERALTPVVGILLLLSLTVLLGATAATFVMGLSDEPTQTPNAAFVFEADRDAGTVTIEHQAGDAIDADHLSVVVEGATCSGSENPNGHFNVDEDFQMGPAEMSSGMSIRYGSDIDIDGTDELCSSDDLSVDGATFRIVWTPPSGNSVTLRTWSA